MAVSRIIEQDVLVIGAGPAGLSVAAECAYHGLSSVRLVEKGASHNQTVSLFYPDEKRVDAAYRGQPAECAGVLCFRDTSKPGFLELMDSYLKQFAFAVDYNVAVDSIKKGSDGMFLVSTGDGRLYGSRFVVISVGRMGKPNRPEYFNAIPASVRAHVHFDTRNLDATGKRILVVGGGNSAVEYAIALSKKGQVVLSYRKEAFTRVNSLNLDNLETAEMEGRVMVWRNSNISAIGEFNGQPKVVFQEGHAQIFDKAVYAIGGSSPAGFLAAAGLELDDKGNPKLSPTLESSVAGLFVAGELAAPQGKGSIIASFNSGKIVVQGIMETIGLERRPELVSLAR
ncbi:MAG: NAD(P)-binding domain-containing protein [Deltaproteobacteria bacterium]|nr:NAD(P)-binding domain-containing protein [Deltaproteobacteria bacterium]